MSAPNHAKMVEICETLRDQTILITGATGFMGKILVEKLIRSVQFKHLYLLVRPKRGLTTQERLDLTLSSPIFDGVKSSSTDIKNRISVIDADLSEHGLGLSAQDRDILTSQVSVIFHAAANVKFDEPLKVAYNINVRGTKELLNLAKKMYNLKAFVHVSTAYSHCYRQRIGEEIYDIPIPYDKLENILEALDDTVIDYMLPKLLGKWPNTYTFTKALAECVVRDFSRDIPVAVFRPGIVSGCYNEPLPGWVDNYYGATGLIVGAYTGLLHVALTDIDAKANLIPVDMSDNAIIATAAKLITTGKEKEVKVYNYIAENSCTYRSMKIYLEKHGSMDRYQGLITAKAMWVYFLFLTPSRLYYLLLTTIFHYIPAIIIDSLSWIVGRKMPIESLWKLYKRVDKANFAMYYFMTRSWDWDISNIRQLWSETSKSDKELFHFDVDSLDWDKYFFNVIKGARVYLLKDSMESLPTAIKKYKKLNTAHQCLKVAGAAVALKLILSFSCVTEFFWSLIGF